MMRLLRLWPVPIIFLGLLPGAGLALGQEATPSGRQVAARVNGNDIMTSSFNLAVQMQFRRRGPGERGHDDLDAVRERALETLIDNELLYQEAARERIDVSEDDIDQELARVEAGFGSRETMVEILEANGVSLSDFRVQLQRTLAVIAFVERKVAGDIDISDEELKAYYDAHPDEMTRQEGARIRQIVIGVPPDASVEQRADARRRIENVLNALRAGGNFAELAAANSDGPEAQRGGESGFVTRGGNALPAVERAALELQPGEISDIISTERGFHIIEVVERRAAGVIPFAEAKDRIRAKLTVHERQERIASYVKRLKGSARIERFL
ncbi:MAG TPA: peptidylprolyl isomerase [Candidatus Polarisedimenticolia bacterium]|nr:peptidylprolyl isomerase [Candidatus Polarisedimenticolia bacterium]